MLSISDGMAASFFNTCIKIITPPPFLRAAEFWVQRYEEKPRYGEKFREKRRISEKNRENRQLILAIIQMLSYVSRSFFIPLLMENQM